MAVDKHLAAGYLGGIPIVKTELVRMGEVLIVQHDSRRRSIVINKFMIVNDQGFQFPLLSKFSTGERERLRDRRKHARGR